MTGRPLALSRAQILAYRQAAGSLGERLPPGPDSLWRAAWAGLQDSAPRAALLSIHARVEGIKSSHWEHDSLVQVWGPRFSVYVIAARDRAVFTLGRQPDDARWRRFGIEMADRLEEFLAGRRMTYSQAGHALGLKPNELRRGAFTGRILIRWDGGRPPDVWTVPAPEMDPGEARLELVRRYLHVYGPSTAAAFGDWSSVGPAGARRAFSALGQSIVPVRTPIDDRRILAADEPAFQDAGKPGSSTDPAQATAIVRFLPSGDAYTLLKGADRELLVPRGGQRSALWTPRVWPGSLLLDGELVGTWRRADSRLTIEAWRRLLPSEREAVEAEAQTLPLPGVAGGLEVNWGN